MKVEELGPSGHPAGHGDADRLTLTVQVSPWVPCPRQEASVSGLRPCISGKPLTSLGLKPPTTTSPGWWVPPVDHSLTQQTFTEYQVFRKSERQV